MNIVGLATTAALLCGALVSPLFLAWGVRCCLRRERRREGLLVMGTGVFLSLCLVVVGYWTAPPDSPGIFRLQAIVILAGVFVIGATIGKAIHLVASRPLQPPTEGREKGTGE